MSDKIEYIQLDNYFCKNEVVKELPNKINHYIKMDKNDLPVNNFGNKILYAMCEESGNTEVDVVASKIWLIGRSYAADLARRKRNPDKDNSPSFYKDIARLLIEDNRFSKISKDIQSLRDEESFNLLNAENILKLHRLLVDLFKESLAETDEVSIEEQWSRRSLASKYLHFHCPKVFYLYDKRAKDSLTHYVQRKNRIEFPPDVDYDYADFCNRMLVLRNYINLKLSPRELDNILLYSD